MAERNIIRAIPWGVALGILKSNAITALRKIAIFLLESAVAYLKDPSANATSDSVVISQGNILSYNLSNLDAKTNGNYSICSANGTNYYIADDTPVIIWQVGSEVQRNGTPTPPGPVTDEITDIQPYHTESTATRYQMTWVRTALVNDVYNFFFKTNSPNLPDNGQIEFHFLVAPDESGTYRGSLIGEPRPSNLDANSKVGFIGYSNWGEFTNQISWITGTIPNVLCYYGPPVSVDAMLNKYPLQ